MSPRRRIDADERDYFAVTPRPPRRWGLPLVATLAGLVLAAVVGWSMFALVSHETERRAELRTAAALDYVRSFMTTYTSLDPFHANDYADRVLAQGTGEFAKTFKEKMNEIVIQVARAEPTQGAVVEAGVEVGAQDRHANGSIDVLVATTTTSKTADGKTIESGNRWVATATQEGQQWKISQLIQVI